MIRRKRFALAITLIALVVLIAGIPPIDAPESVFGDSLSLLPPAFFPFVAASMLLALSVAEFRKIDARQDEAPRESSEPPDTGVVISVIACIVLFGILVERIGYVGSAVLAASLTCLIGKSRFLAPVAAVSFVVSGAVYWILTRVFAIYLPPAQLFDHVLF